VRDLSSELTGKQHRLLIALPPSFEKEPSRRYPVLFVLDGQWDFPLVATISGGLRYDEVLPEMLTVGLTWGGEKPNYDALRSDDYLPTRAKGRDGVEKGGGAPRFLSFLEQDIIPLLEREYRADPEHRILAGTSNGGLFALYTLFEKPELFWGYVAVSPNVGWDERNIFAKEKAFRASHPTLERRLWLSSGSAEWPDYLARETAFFKQLTASHYRGLALQVYSVPGERHAGVKPEAYNRALRFIAQPLLTPSR
jgi:predicted alpha/beta superfamily hydrolase